VLVSHLLSFKPLHQIFITAFSFLITLSGFLCFITQANYAVL
jgi:hypothetical protein